MTKVIFNLELRADPCMDAVITPEPIANMTYQIDTATPESIS